MGRIAVFQYATVGVFLFRITGFWLLQIRDHEADSTLAERNRIKTVPLIAARGKILDRDGRVIVDNQPAFVVQLTQENLKLEHLARCCGVYSQSSLARVRHPPGARSAAISGARRCAAPSGETRAERRTRTGMARGKDNPEFAVRRRGDRPTYDVDSAECSTSVSVARESRACA